MTEDISDIVEIFEEECRKGGASKKEIEEMFGPNSESALAEAQHKYLSKVVRVIVYDPFVERLGYIG